MHDSEFAEGDFGYHPAEKKFFLQTRIVCKQETILQNSIAVQHEKRFRLEIFNVKKYNPVNLFRIQKGQATGGVFNYIKVRDHGKRVTIVSQDLQIMLELTSLAGNFEEA